MEHHLPPRSIFSYIVYAAVIVGFVLLAAGCVIGYLIESPWLFFPCVILLASAYDAIRPRDGEQDEWIY
ncbi:MAG: hypothetical protein ABIG71_01195 [Candidatus Uhrbacteria bacterium]